MEDQQRDRERLVGQHSLGHRLGRADDGAGRAEARLELLLEALEQVDVLGLLARELQEGAGPRVVRRQPRPGVVEQEGQDEFLDQPEEVEVAVAADLVEQQLLARASLSVSYRRRWFHGFFVADNLALQPSDLTPFSIVAPLDPRLPGGGGYALTFYDIKPA